MGTSGTKRGAAARESVSLNIEVTKELSENVNVFAFMRYELMVEHLRWLREMDDWADGVLRKNEGRP